MSNERGLRPRAARPLAARAAVYWAVSGVLLVLLNATLQLGARAVAVLRTGLTPLQWLAFAALAALFLYGEGVRALQRRWVPHVLTRAAELAFERRLWVRLLAPAYAFSLVAAPRRSLLRAWAGVAAIITAVLIVRAFPEPWRGITDGAVALALAWGMGAILVQAPPVLRGDGGESA